MQSLEAAKKVAERVTSFAPRGALAAVVVRGPAAEQRRAFTAKDKSKSVYEYGAHRSDAEELIAQQPIVMVDTNIALCTGGGGALGHPLDYIQLNNPTNEPRECRYCGIRYQMKKH